MRLLKVVLLITFGIALTATGATAATLITGKQVKDGTLTGKDLKNGSVTRKDLALSARGLNGTNGKDGAQGPTGAPGQPTATGNATDTTLISAGQTFTAEAVCPDSSPYAVSGGYHIEDPAGIQDDTLQPTVLINEAVAKAPENTHRYWRVTVRNDGPTALVLRADAVCMNTPPF